MQKEYYYYNKDEDSYALTYVPLNSPYWVEVSKEVYYENNPEEDVTEGE